MAVFGKGIGMTFVWLACVILFLCRAQLKETVVQSCFLNIISHRVLVF